MSHQSIHLAQSIARERERETLRRLDHRQAEAQRATPSAGAPQSTLAQRWREAMTHLHLTRTTAR